MQNPTMVTSSELLAFGKTHGISVKTLERLSIYEDLLRQWQKKTNLVSPMTLDALWARHFGDSLQCRALMEKPGTIVDLGSGGGFPGMVLAIAFAEDGDIKPEIHLVESIAKKCAFLRQVARACNVEAQVQCERIETMGDLIARADVITARALAPLSKLLSWCEPGLKNQAVALFHKGRDYRAELAEAHGLYRFDLVEHGSKIEADSVILEIRNLVSLKAET